MNLITYPLNNIEYGAEDAELFHCTRTSGVFAGDDFDISAGSGSSVTIAAGIGWIRNTKFSGKVIALKSQTKLILPNSSASYPRYDAVVITFDATRNSTEIGYKSGVASSNPIRPSVVRTSNIYELHLYHILRPTGSTSISSSDIIDLRGNTDYCGYMVDDVSAFDEGKFLSKSGYDPTNSVMNAGGIAAYVQNKLTSYIPANLKGQKNGVASLDATGKVPSSQLPEITSVVMVKWNNGNPSLTFTEIKNAISSGKMVFLQGLGGLIAPLTLYDVSRVEFSTFDADGQYLYTIKTGTATYEYIDTKTLHALVYEKGSILVSDTGSAAINEAFKNGRNCVLKDDIGNVFPLLHTDQYTALFGAPRYVSGTHGSSVIARIDLFNVGPYQSSLGYAGVDRYSYTFDATMSITG